jgi:hypothetical protein
MPYESEGGASWDMIRLVAALPMSCYIVPYITTRICDQEHALPTDNESCWLQVMHAGAAYGSVSLCFYKVFSL